MSQDVLEIFQTMNKDNVDTQFSMQCAPLVARLKISNLYMVDNDQFHEAVRMLKSLKTMGIDYVILLRSRAKTTFLVYEKQALKEYLFRDEVRQFLSEDGYETTELSESLRKFVLRFRDHRKNQSGFPHEMGVFLGYPMIDILGFIEKNGHEFLYNGYWKVYGNLRETVDLFQHFQWAEKEVLTMCASGMSISDIAEIYYRNCPDQAAS